MNVGDRVFVEHQIEGRPDYPGVITAVGDGVIQVATERGGYPGYYYDPSEVRPAPKGK